jgi:M6 family metalloprotease-like protein
MKLRAFVLSLGVLLSLVPAYSALAPKPGSSCSKAGLVQNYNGKKYTCLKVGKKLVWNMGVATTKPTPYPTPTPTQSSTPSPNPTTAPAPTPTQSSTPSPTPSPTSPTPTYSSTPQPTQSATSPSPLDLSNQPCTNIDEVVQNTAGKFKCIKTANSDKPFWAKDQTFLGRQGAPLIPPTNPLMSSVQISTNLNQTPSVSDIESCKIKDARITKTQPNNSGFPLSKDLLPASGQFTFLIAPIDFADAAGSIEDLASLKEQVTAFSNWFTFHSNGKLKLNVIIGNKWFRDSKLSTQYSTRKGGANEPNPYANAWDQFAQDFIDDLGTTYNFNDIDGVIFHFPNNQKTDISEAILGRGVSLRTPQGVKSLFYWGDGNYMYQLANDLKSTNPFYWAQLYTHETLHSMGISLHSPGNGFYTGIGQNQAGSSWVLDAWEQFKLGWLDSNQVYCLPKNLITKNQILLQPLEEKLIGYKTIIIPLASTTALVIESRRPTNYSSGWPDNYKGLLVYQIDTTLDTDRSQESTGLDNGNDRKYSKWAYYLPSDQRPPIYSQNNANNEAIYSYLILPGETVTFDGVKISLNQQSSFDYVEITKN